MASVREELIAFLLLDFECDRPSATKAVDKAIEANPDDESFGQDIEGTAEYIYDTQKYWE